MTPDLPQRETGPGEPEPGITIWGQFQAQLPTRFPLDKPGIQSREDVELILDRIGLHLLQILRIAHSTNSPKPSLPTEGIGVPSNGWCFGGDLFEPGGNIA